MSDGAEKRVYHFGGGSAEGSREQKGLLGGKGAGLAEMSRIGVPVPPGFTLTTAACAYFQRHGGGYPDGLREEVEEHLERLEGEMGRRFGNAADPLLVSVRSGAVFSMPGMMDTVLNLGLSRRSLVECETAEPRFLRDCYRRLLSMYGDVVLGVPHERFEEILKEARSSAGAAHDHELPAASLDALIERYEALVEEVHGAPFPQDPREQLWGAIGAVFRSWDNRRAREYRRLHDLPDDLGTAVNVQAMVFGNRGEQCATGVAFTRSPATGEPGLYGEYLVNAQGEDVVAGIRTPQVIEGTSGEGGLGTRFPEAHQALVRVAATLESHYREMQDLEFTIEDGTLYLLQTRTGKRTGPAAVRIAVDLCRAGTISREEALQRVTPSGLAQLLAPGFDPSEKAAALASGRLLARGLPAGPGAASGRLALTAERAVEAGRQDPVILVREETSPEDIVGMHAAVGILTARGGMTSHAAVVARGMGKPCIVGADALAIDEAGGLLRAGEQRLEEGDWVSIDGATGEVVAGRLASEESPILRALVDGEDPTDGDLFAAFRDLLSWADEVRRLKVRTNADTPRDARVARAFGAEGIGLCRTEHMFFAEDRISWVREMILAPGESGRRRALEHLLPVQQADFEEILAAMDGLPVTVRLLDPPLHEFLPRDAESIGILAEQLGVSPASIAEAVRAHSETNPMLGHRGCRLGLTAPEIYEMQVEAIVRAAVARVRGGGEPRVEIMMPLVGGEEEIRVLRERTTEVISRILTAEGVDLPMLIGTMIEIPRACLLADRIAGHADFFSFGTNDLTQLTYGYSRDDVGRFLSRYLEEGILPFDPFDRLDESGVGQLVSMATERGKAARPDLKVGICGEHGGEPHSVAFFDRVGLDYVSCSPYRVPIARLAAAQSVLAG